MDGPRALLNEAGAPNSAPEILFTGSGKGSWYSQYKGKYTWEDDGDAPGSAALGVPDDCQGVSFYAPSTLGKWFWVKAPNGIISLEQQTDIGPNPNTGRKIDISAAAAERFGYSPNNFPTDGVFRWAATSPPTSVADLSPRQQGVKYRDLRNVSPAPTPIPVPPPVPVPGPAPVTGLPWMDKAKSYIGFHEKGENEGIEHFISLAHCGSVGDPWCAIFVNACLEESGFAGTRSALARSFERSPNFVKLSGPAYGAITTMWRTSRESGEGHVYFYVGENDNGNLGLGGNQNDQVCVQYEDKVRVTGYWWPKQAALPKTGPVKVKDTAHWGRED